MSTHVVARDLAEDERALARSRACHAVFQAQREREAEQIEFARSHLPDVFAELYDETPLLVCELLKPLRELYPGDFRSAALVKALVQLDDEGTVNGSLLGWVPLS
jgi:hypothetical protein